MFARISGSVASDLLDEGPSSYPANAWIWSEQTIAAQRRRLGCPPLQSSKSSKSSGHDRHRGSLVVCCASSSRRHKAAQLLRRPPKFRNATAGFLQTSLYTTGSTSGSRHCSPVKQQQQQAPVNPNALTACIKAAVSHHELEALCNTFLHNASFSAEHAALVLNRLHQVHSRKQDSQLLLVELLAAKLHSSFSAATEAAAAATSASSSKQPQLLSPSEVAAVCWSFAKIGYQPHAGLLQPLLQQFWKGYNQQQQQGDVQPDSTICQDALSQLAAGLAGLGFRDPAVWAQLRSAAVVVIADMQPACLQQLVWALATVQASDATTTAALVDAVLQRMQQFTAEEVAQTAWCFHVLGYSGNELYEQAAQQMVICVETAAGYNYGSSGSSSGSMSRLTGALGKADDGSAMQQQTHHAASAAACSEVPRISNGCRPQQQQQIHIEQQRQQQQPSMERPKLSCAKQGGARLQQIALRLPHTLQQPQQHTSSAKQRCCRQHSATVSNAADLYSAAARQAYSVLEQYDPLLCTLALYRDYFQPAQAGF